MACRGPDAEGSWLERHAALGHRRLAVIDIEGGTQPMSMRTEHGAVTITYSGETYNFTELRDELRRLGHRFRTRSDTEVVLQDPVIRDFVDKGTFEKLLVGQGHQQR